MEYRYTPCDMWESSPGVWVFDFCQNMVSAVLPMTWVAV